MPVLGNGEANTSNSTFSSTHNSVISIEGYGESQTLSKKFWIDMAKDADKQDVELINMVLADPANMKIVISAPISTEVDATVVSDFRSRIDSAKAKAAA